MAAVFPTTVKFDLLKVGHCQHPECAALRGGGRRAIDFPALVGLIEHPRLGLMLYDTGYSGRFNEVTRGFPECLYRWVTPVTLPPEEELLRQLEERGIRASDVETVFISHFHADHVAGLRDFPRARFIATREEYARSKGWGRWKRLRRAFLPALLPDDLEKRLVYAEDCSVMQAGQGWEPFTEVYDLAGDGSLMGVNLPGHTASQLGVALTAEKVGNVFLVGDACWKMEGIEQGRGPSRLAYRLFDSAEQYDETFQKLMRLHSGPDAPLMIPSHCLRTWQERGGTRRVVRGD